MNKYHTTLVQEARDTISMESQENHITHLIDKMVLAEVEDSRRKVMEEVTGVAVKFKFTRRRETQIQSSQLKRRRKKKLKLNRRKLRMWNNQVNSMTTEEEREEDMMMKLLKKKKSLD
jgi:hypothetical protein